MQILPEVELYTQAHVDQANSMRNLTNMSFVGRVKNGFSAKANNGTKVLFEAGDTVSLLVHEKDEADAQELSVYVESLEDIASFSYGDRAFHGEFSCEIADMSIDDFRGAFRILNQASLVQEAFFRIREMVDNNEEIQKMDREADGLRDAGEIVGIVGLAGTCVILGNVVIASLLGNKELTGTPLYFALAASGCLAVVAVPSLLVKSLCERLCKRLAENHRSKMMALLQKDYALIRDTMQQWVANNPEQEDGALPELLRYLQVRPQKDARVILSSAHMRGANRLTTNEP